MKSKNGDWKHSPKCEKDLQSLIKNKCINIVDVKSSVSLLVAVVCHEFFSLFILSMEIFGPGNRKEYIWNLMRI